MGKRQQDGATRRRRGRKGNEEGRNEEGHQKWKCPTAVGVGRGGRSGRGGGRGGGTGGGRGGGRDDSAREDARATSHTRTMRSNRTITQEGSETVVQLYDTEVVRIGEGILTLNSGGYSTVMTMDCMNEALEPFGFTVKVNGESWQVSDGKMQLLRFYDGMAISLPKEGKGKGGKGKGKGSGWWDEYEGWGGEWDWWGKGKGKGNGKGSGGAHRVVQQRPSGVARFAPY